MSKTNSRVSPAGQTIPMPPVAAQRRPLPKPAPNMSAMTTMPLSKHSQMGEEF